MILIGQYDSPFVRRVGIALLLYELPFEHQPWSVFSEGDKVRELNPLMRVPTLVLNDGTVLLDSHMMLDYLDSLVPPERALFPRVEPARHRALRIATLATGLGEKSASLFYEKRMHDQVSETWAGRCRTHDAGRDGGPQSRDASRRTPAAAPAGRTAVVTQGARAVDVLAPARGVHARRSRGRGDRLGCAGCGRQHARDRRDLPARRLAVTW